MQTFTRLSCYLYFLEDDRVVRVDGVEGVLVVVGLQGDIHVHSGVRRVSGRKISQEPDHQHSVLKQ